MMRSIITLCKRQQNLDLFTPKMPILNNIKSCDICTPVSLNLSNSLRKSDKMIDKPHILSLFLNSFNKFNKTWALM